MKTSPLKTKLLTALLTLCMLLSLVPISAFAEDLTVSNETDLEAALGNADCAEIKLGENIETTETLNVERTVTLDLNGYSLSCSSTDEDIIRVCSSGSLTIKDSGTGGKIDGQNKNCGFDVKGGTLTLESGSIVNCVTDGDGGAVDVSNTGVTETPIKYGQFIMNGGTIMDCKAFDDAGAVDIGRGCTFTMNGGTIGNCRADDDGGAVFIKQNGFFVMNGGTIENCSAGAEGGAVYIYEDGRFAMTGGTIKSCTVDLGGLGMAVYGRNDKAVVTMTGGTFENCGAYPYKFDAFTVTFDSDGGSAVPEQKLRNAPAVKPADPTKDGYDFAGWYLFDTLYAFDTNVTENITLTAKWTPTTTSTTITAATIENVKFNYQPSDAPQATATVAAADADKYEISYECWQQFENNAPVAAWYSDNGSHGSLPTITAFESGKSYVYSLMLTPKDGYSFASETVITVNGQNVSAPFVGGAMYIPAIKTITMRTPPEKYTVTYTDGVDGEEIFKDQTYTVESGEATPAFSGTPARDGYKFTGWSPAVTATVTSNATYTAQWEKLTSAETFTVTYTDGVDGEEIFKDQTYTVESGKDTPAFSGTPARDGYKFTGWSPAVTATVTSNATYTAQWEKLTSAETFTVTYTDGVDGEEIFKDQTYTVESGKATPAFNGMPTRKGYTFTGWKPAVAATVTGNATYEATWKPYPVTTPPSDSKPSAGKTTIPQTGDTSNPALWFALLFISGSAAIGTAVVSRKKKYDR